MPSTFSKSADELIALLRLLDSPVFRALLRQTTSVTTPVYKPLEQIHAVLAETLDLSTLLAGSRYAKDNLIVRTNCGNWSGAVAFRRFPGTRIPSKAQEPDNRIGSILGIEFRIGNDEAARNDGLAPGVYRIYVEPKNIRLESTAFRMVTAVGTIGAFLNIVDLHLPSRIVQIYDYAFSPTDCINIGPERAIFPMHFTSARKEFLPSEPDTGVVREFRRVKDKPKILAYSTMSFVRSVGNIGFYEGQSFGNKGPEEIAPSKDVGFLCLEEVTEFIKDDFTPPKNITMGTREDVEVFVKEHAQKQHFGFPSVYQERYEGIQMLALLEQASTPTMVDQIETTTI